MRRFEGLREAVAWLAAVSLCSGLMAITGVFPTPAANAQPSRPNILILLSDDQAWSTFNRSLMPTVYSQLVDQGVTFDRAYVNTSLCCPSRSEILTGLYQHHTGVAGNATPLARPTIVNALHDQGYRTSLDGKYLNSAPCDPRPEFDNWVCESVPPSSYTLVNPYMNVNGAWTHFTGYTTDILANDLAGFIRSTPADQPFFALYSPTTPHLPANDPRYASMPVAPVRDAAYDENTTSDGKPRYVQRGPLTPSEVSTVDTWHRQMAQSVRSLDDSVATILNSLGDRAQNTLVFYLSDNGYLYGEHRRWEKEAPYEESMKVPFVVRYPAVHPTTAPATSEALVENVDVVPTIADAIGYPWGADGASLIPLLTGQATSVRDAALIEQCQPMPGQCPGGTPAFLGQVTVPAFWGVVTSGSKYVEYTTGEKELYDISADPSELTNLAGNPAFADLQAQLASELATLRAPPPVDTTIVTGPQGVAAGRTVTFTYFSQSRLATYQCRLDANGVPGPWSACNGQSDRVGPLPDGDYTFEVAGTDETGATDPTPATRAFSLHTTGPDASVDSGPPARSSATSATFAFSSRTPGATFRCSLALLGAVPSWAPCDPAAGASYGPLADGLWSFEAAAVDPASGAATDPPAQWIFQVDTTGPRMVFSAAPGPATQSATADFVFSAAEPTSGPYACALDAGPGTDCSSGSFSAGGMAEGQHTLAVTAADDLGNSATTTYAWTVDRTPPVATVAGGPGAYSKVSSVQFALTSNEGGTVFRCQLDGGPVAACVGVAAYSGTQDGSHAFVASAVDAAGNISAPVTRTWVQDMVKPTLSQVVAAPNPFSPNADLKNDTTTISAAATEPVNWWLVIRTSKGATVLTKAVTSPTPSFSYVWNGTNAYGWKQADGVFGYSLTGTDPAGNSSAASGSITLDTKAPTTLVTVSPAAISPNADGVQDISTFTATLSEPATWNLFITTAAGVTVKSGWYSGVPVKGVSVQWAARDNFTATVPDGSYTVWLYMTDAAGNRGWAAAYVTVDTKAPSTTISSGPADPTTETSASFAFSASEPGATSTCSLDGGAPATCSTGVTYASLAPGPHSFAVQSKDAAGNLGPPAAWTWTVV